MCSLVILRRPDHAWPLMVAANRDEMAGRPWSPPGRHWPDRSDVTAGLDRTAGGSWLGINDFGLMAAILNRAGSLGPAPDKRSRGELVLDALDHADADAAADAMAALDGRAYRPFNLVIADNRDAFWLRSVGRPEIEVRPIPGGLHMLTEHDLDDETDLRINTYLPRFRAAAIPDPAQGRWEDWRGLLADTGDGATDRTGQFMLQDRTDGFGTISSSLIALPGMDRGGEIPPVWLFCAGRPDRNEFRPVY
jgi:hypothetical protein